MMQTHILYKVCSYSVYPTAFVKNTVHRNISLPPVINDSLVGFFDGAKKDRYCGAYMVVRMNLNHAFWLRMDAGCGTNTRSDLLVLWGLLYFSSKIHVGDL